jgi:hypothetical protein
MEIRKYLEIHLTRESQIEKLVLGSHLFPLPVRAELGAPQDCLPLRAAPCCRAGLLCNGPWKSLFPQEVGYVFAQNAKCNVICLGKKGRLLSQIPSASTPTSSCSCSSSAPRLRPPYPSRSQRSSQPSFTVENLCPYLAVVGVILINHNGIFSGILLLLHRVIKLIGNLNLIHF